MSNYIYQHSIDFQYTYGVTGIFFYLVVLNLRNIPFAVKRYYVPVTLICSLLLVNMTMFSRMYYIENYYKNHETYQEMNKALATIPKDASVEANTFLIPRLSQRDELYELPSYKHQFTTDYAVFDLRYGEKEKHERDIKLYLKKGYEIELQLDELLVILKKVSDN